MFFFVKFRGRGFIEHQVEGEKKETCLSLGPAYGHTGRPLCSDDEIVDYSCKGQRTLLIC